MMRRLCVTNVPLHVRKEEFGSIFRPLDGCLECRLVSLNNRPVGFVTFATEQQARNAHEAYNHWQGFGQGGLMIEIISTDPGGPRPAPMAQQPALQQPPFQGLPAQRPPPEVLDTAMYGAGGFKQMRHDAPQMEYGGAPRLDGAHHQQPPPQERFAPPGYEPLDRAAAPYGPAGGAAAPGPAFTPRGPQYDEPFATTPGGGRAPQAAGRFPESEAVGGVPPMERMGGTAPAGMAFSGPAPGPERLAPGQSSFPAAGYDDRPLPQQHLQQTPAMLTAYAPEPRPFAGDPYGPGPAAAPRLHPAPEPARGAPQYGGPQYDGGYPADQPQAYQAAQQQQQQQQQNPPLHHEAPPAAYFDHGQGPQGPEYAPPRAAYEAASSYEPSGNQPAPELPHDARASLYVETVPKDATRREIAHIFRAFAGFKEVRLVEKPSKINAGEVLVHAFAEFTDAHSATEALNALQGYLMDPMEEGSLALRIKYATDRHFGRPAPGGPGREGRGGRGSDFGRGSGGGRGGGRSHDAGGRGEHRRGDGGRGRSQDSGGRGDDRRGDGGRGRGKRRRFY